MSLHLPLLGHTARVVEGQDNGKIVLSQDTTLYVNKSGSDSAGANGISNPFLTIGALLAYVRQNYDANGYALTLQVGNGTYAEAVNLPSVSGGSILVADAIPGLRLVGDPTTPSNVVIASTGSNMPLTCQGIASPWYLDGVTLDVTTVNQWYPAIQVDYARLDLGAIRFKNQSANVHDAVGLQNTALCTAQNGKTLTMNGNFNHLLAAYGASTARWGWFKLAVTADVTLTGGGSVVYTGGGSRVLWSLVEAMSGGVVHGQSYYVDAYSALEGAGGVPGDVAPFVSTSGGVAVA